MGSLPTTRLLSLVSSRLLHRLVAGFFFFYIVETENASSEASRLSSWCVLFCVQLTHNHVAIDVSDTPVIQIGESEVSLAAHTPT